MDDENADLADELRQRMKGKARQVLVLSLLGLGIPVGVGYLVLILLVKLPILYACALAGAFLLLVALASFGLSGMLRARTQRTLALLAVADQLGLAFREVATPGLIDKLRGLEMFSAASGIAAYNALSGSFEGCSVTVVDCVVSAGQATFESTVLILRGIPPHVPDFYLTPHDFFSRGKPAIKLTGQPEFNKRFHLQGEDAQAMRRTFTAGVIEMCQANQNVEVAQPLLVVMRRGKRLSPAEYETFLRGCVRLAKTLGGA